MGIHDLMFINTGVLDTKMVENTGFDRLLVSHSEDFFKVKSSLSHCSSSALRDHTFNHVALLNATD